MKWLKSTTQKAWTVQGKVIPPCVTPDNRYLVIEDSEYATISKFAVVASLIKAGDIIVLSTEPAELKNSVESLQGDKASLMAEVTRLQEQLKAQEKKLAVTSSIDVEKIKEEAQAEIKAQAVAELEEKEARIKELEALLSASNSNSASE